MGSRTAQRDWPLLTRARERDELVAAVGTAPVRARIVTGAPGVGKTVLAGSAAAHTGRDVVRVIALPELAAIPLAAFAPALAQLGVPSDPVRAVPELLARVGRSAGRHLLLVDDAPWLDDVSAAAVHQLVRGFGVPAIITARLGEALPAPLARLVDEGAAEVRMLDGLGEGEVALLLEARFGAPVRHEHVARLAGRTGGNPLFLRMLVETAVRRGDVEIEDGFVEIADGGTPTGLLDTIAARVDALDAGQRHQLHLIALTQPAERALVDRDDRDARVTERLIDGGAVVVEATTGRLRIAHPLIGEALATDADRAEVAIEAAARLRGRGSPAERFTATLLELHAGASPPLPDVVWASGYAYGIGDLATAITLAADAQRHPAGLEPAERFAAALTSASARSVRGELDEAEADFAFAAANARTVDERAALAARHGEHLAYRRFDVAAAIAQAEAVQGDARAGASGLDAELRIWRAILGQVHGASADLSDAERLPPEVAVRGAMAAIMTESMGGRADAAHEAAAVLTRVQERMGVLDPAAAAMLGFNEYIHLLSLGEHERALEYAEARRLDAGDGVGLWTCVVAEHLNYNGRLDEALHAAALAVDQCRWRDGMGVLALTLALQADALAKAGDVAGARGILASLEPAQRSEPKAVMMIAECEAWLAHADGDDARAAAIVEGAAEAAAGVGYLLVAAISLGVCIRLGRVERAAEMLEDICARVPAEFGLYTALRDLAVAVRDRQPARVAPAAIRLGRAGMAPTALDAISLALRMRPGAEARHRLETAAVTLSIGVDAPLIHRRETPLLSERQLEMALAAAGRERSREIADRLGVSVRTVDNLLQTVYRKLGVSSRDELRAALVEAGLAAD